MLGVPHDHAKPPGCARPRGRVDVREPVLRQLVGSSLPAGRGGVVRGVLGEDLGNPIADWAEHGVERGVVPYGVAPDMKTPYPDRGRSTSTSTPSCSAPSARPATAEWP